MLIMYTLHVRIIHRCVIPGERECDSAVSTLTELKTELKQTLQQATEQSLLVHTYVRMFIEAHLLQVQYRSIIYLCKYTAIHVHNI